MCGGRLQDWISKARNSRQVLLGIVFYVYLVDYMLFTAVVPIYPELLVESDMETLTEQIESTNEQSQHENNTVFMATPSKIALVEDKVPKPTKFENGQYTVTPPDVNATSENTKVGWLLSAKALVQIAASPVIGFLSSRIAYRNLLLFGTMVQTVSSSILAGFGSFIPLLIARALHGIGSAATTISGMSLLAENYTDDKERSRTMGTAMSGLALGVLIGYPFGGLVFAALGRAVPFVAIAILCLIGIVLQIRLTDRTNLITRFDVSLLSMWRVCKDPYILVCSGALMITVMSLAVLESTVPIWVMDTMDVEQWQLGIIFIPDSVSYLLGISLFPVIVKKYGRWLFTLGSMLLIGVGAIVLPFCKNIEELIVPHLSLGLGVGVTDAAIYPLLALLVDQRQLATYGSVYAIGQLAICLAFFIGPAIAGQIVPVAGFKWCMWGIAILNFVFAPTCLLLRAPPVLQDKQRILDAMEDNTVYSDTMEHEVFSYHTFDGISDKRK